MSTVGLSWRTPPATRVKRHQLDFLASPAGTWLRRSPVSVHWHGCPEDTAGCRLTTEETTLNICFILPNTCGPEPDPGHILPQTSTRGLSRSIGAGSGPGWSKRVKLDLFGLRYRCADFTDEFCTSTCWTCRRCNTNAGSNTDLTSANTYPAGQTAGWSGVEPVQQLDLQALVMCDNGKTVSTEHLRPVNSPNSALSAVM